MEEFLAKLNPEQLKAATHVSGPLFVVAGAGTGKTRTLTTRVAYLIKEAGVPADSILAVTFTNKAAREMKERIIHMAGPYASSVWISTVHSLSAKLLRSDIEVSNLGYKKTFNIADEDDAKSIIREDRKSVV